MSLKTPHEWAKIYDVVILDPDGWRKPTEKDMNEPISRREWEQRMSVSTCQFGPEYIKRCKQDRGE